MAGLLNVFSVIANFKFSDVHIAWASSTISLFKVLCTYLYITCPKFTLVYSSLWVPRKDASLWIFAPWKAAIPSNGKQFVDAPIVLIGSTTITNLSTI